MRGNSDVRGPAEILRRYRGGERDFRGLEIGDLKGGPADLRGQFLDGADFRECYILADFTNASLRNCNFANTNVKTCSFDGADLRGCDFSNAAVDSATFREAKVEGATFAGATAYGYAYLAGDVPE